MKARLILFALAVLATLNVHSQTVPAYCKPFSSNPNGVEFCSVADAAGPVDLICDCAQDWDNYKAYTIYVYQVEHCTNELCRTNALEAFEAAEAKNQTLANQCQVWLDLSIETYPADCEGSCDDDVCNGAAATAPRHLAAGHKYIANSLYAPLLEKELENTESLDLQLMLGIVKSTQRK